MRTQVHGPLGKTGTRTQAELIRIATLLLNSVPASPEPGRRHRPPLRAGGTGCCTCLTAGAWTW